MADGAEAGGASGAVVAAAGSDAGPAAFMAQLAAYEERARAAEARERVAKSREAAAEALAREAEARAARAESALAEADARAANALAEANARAAHADKEVEVLEVRLKEEYAARIQGAANAATLATRLSNEAAEHRVEREKWMAKYEAMDKNFERERAHLVANIEQLKTEREHERTEFDSRYKQMELLTARVTESIQPHADAAHAGAPGGAPAVRHSQEPEELLADAHDKQGGPQKPESPPPQQQPATWPPVPPLDKDEDAQVSFGAGTCPDDNDNNSSGTARVTLEKAIEVQQPRRVATEAEGAGPASQLAGADGGDDGEVVAFLWKRTANGGFALGPASSDLCVNEALQARKEGRWDELKELQRNMKAGFLGYMNDIVALRRQAKAVADAAAARAHTYTYDGGNPGASPDYDSDNDFAMVDAAPDAALDGADVDEDDDDIAFEVFAGDADDGTSEERRDEVDSGAGDNSEDDDDAMSDDGATMEDNSTLPHAAPSLARAAGGMDSADTHRYAQKRPAGDVLAPPGGHKASKQARRRVTPKALSAADVRSLEAELEQRREAAERANPNIAGMRGGGGMGPLETLIGTLETPGSALARDVVEAQRKEIEAQWEATERPQLDKTRAVIWKDVTSSSAVDLAQELASFRARLAKLTQSLVESFEDECGRGVPPEDAARRCSAMKFTVASICRLKYLQSLAGMSEAPDDVRAEDQSGDGEAQRPTEPVSRKHSGRGNIARDVGSTVTLVDLIKAGLVEAGNNALVLRLKQQEFVADLDKDGTIRFEGCTFNSLNAFGSHVAKLFSDKLTVSAWFATRHQGKKMSEYKATYKQQVREDMADFIEDDMPENTNAPEREKKEEAPQRVHGVANGETINLLATDCDDPADGIAQDSAPAAKRTKSKVRATNTQIIHPASTSPNHSKTYVLCSLSEGDACEVSADTEQPGSGDEFWLPATFVKPLSSDGRGKYASAQVKLSQASSPIHTALVKVRPVPPSAPDDELRGFQDVTVGETVEVKVESKGAPGGIWKRLVVARQATAGAWYDCATLAEIGLQIGGNIGDASVGQNASVDAATDMDASPAWGRVLSRLRAAKGRSGLEAFDAFICAHGRGLNDVPPGLRRLGAQVANATVTTAAPLLRDGGERMPRIRRAANWDPAGQKWTPIAALPPRRCRRLLKNLGSRSDARERSRALARCHSHAFAGASEDRALASARLQFARKLARTPTYRFDDTKHVLRVSDPSDAAQLATDSNGRPDREFVYVSSKGGRRRGGFTKSPLSQVRRAKSAGKDKGKGRAVPSPSAAAARRRARDKKSQRRLAESTREIHAAGAPLPAGADLDGADNGAHVLRAGIPQVCGGRDITVLPYLANQLKNHQWDGLRYVWDAIVSRPRMAELSDSDSDDDGDDDDDGTGRDDATGGCILGHSMGLGKSLQAIALMHTLRKYELATRFLLVVPANVVFNWVQELGKWLPNGESFVLYNCTVYTRDDRARAVVRWARDGGLLLMTYHNFAELVSGAGRMPSQHDDVFAVKAMKDAANKLSECTDLVILDEGHELRNSSTQKAAAFSSFQCPMRVVLTGYPLQNSLEEYWTMMNFVAPGFLGTEGEFREEFVVPIKEGNQEGASSTDRRLMKRQLHVLRGLVEDHCHRLGADILQAELAAQGVTLHEHVLRVAMVPFQEALYARWIDLAIRANVDSFVVQFAGRRIMCHPHLFKVIDIDGTKKEDAPISVDALTDASIRAVDAIEAALVRALDGRDFRSGPWPPPSQLGAFVATALDSAPEAAAVAAGLANQLKGYGENGRDTTLAELNAEKRRLAVAGAVSSICTPQHIESLHRSACKGGVNAVIAQNESIALALGKEYVPRVMATRAWRLAKADATDGGASEPSGRVSVPPDPTHAAKLRVLLSIADAVQQKGEKLLVFTDSVEFIQQVLVPVLRKLGWRQNAEYFHIDGSVVPAKRQDAVRHFNKSKRARMFILSTKAGALGINLTSANHCVLFDEIWNPSWRNQALHRCFRMGQEKPVHVYRLIGSGTFEEMVYKTSLEKERLFCSVVDSQNVGLASHRNKKVAFERYTKHSPDLDGMTAVADGAGTSGAGGRAAAEHSSVLRDLARAGASQALPLLSVYSARDDMPPEQQLDRDDRVGALRDAVGRFSRMTGRKATAAEAGSGGGSAGGSAAAARAERRVTRQRQRKLDELLRREERTGAEG